MRETHVRSLGQEDPLEKKMATHSSTLAWKIPWTEKPGRVRSMGSKRVGHDLATSLHFTLLYEVNIQEEQDGKADGESCLQLLQNCPHMGPIVVLIFLGNQDALMGNSPSADLFS